MKFKRSTEIPFFFIESSGKYNILAYWEEIALVAEIFKSKKDDFALTKIYYPFIFARLENSKYLGFDGFHYPGNINVPIMNLDSTHGEKWATKYSTLISNLKNLHDQIGTVETTKSEMIAPLPPGALRFFSILSRRKFESYPLGKITLLDLCWGETEDQSFPLNFDALSLLNTPINRISDFLNFLAGIIPEWLHIARQEDNRRQDQVTQVTSHDTLMRESLNEVIAYYEDIIANLRWEIAELKAGKKGEEFSALAVAELLEVDDPSGDSATEISSKERLMNLVQKVRDSLNNLKKELEGLLNIFGNAFQIRMFKEAFHLVSVPIFVIAPIKKEITKENTEFLYPSIIPLKRRYRSQNFNQFAVLSPLGSYMNDIFENKMIPTETINNALKITNFYEFKHKPSTDIGKQGLRKKELIL